MYLPRKTSIIAVLSTLGMFLVRQNAAFKFGTSVGKKSFAPHLGLQMSADSDHFDYLVIGGGSGGIASARRAATHGVKVGVIERQALGGTCVNVGCVPKKVMFNAAHAYEVLEESKHYGFKVGESKFDWGTIADARNKYVTRLNGIYSNNLKNSEVTSIDGLASLAGGNKVTVGDKTYTADHILIAVGGKPRILDMPGIEHTITSDGFFQLKEQPKKAAVIGSGYIAVEMAGIFHALGTDTTLVFRREAILNGFDPYITDALTTEMNRQGLNLSPNSAPVAYHKEESTGLISIELKDGRTLDGFDCVLSAVGRVPLTEPLKLDAAGVTTDPKTGYITVDEYQNTKADGIYALGDVCGNVELTPMAIAAGRRLADRLFGGQTKARASYDMVPTVVFSHPTIGTIGLTEAEARAKYRGGEGGDGDEVKVYTSMFVNLWYGPWQIEPKDKPRSCMKVVVVGDEERVVGMHCMGMGADELIQGFGVAMKMGCTKADLDDCVAVHPTAAEEFVTLAPWGQSGRHKTDFL